MKLKYFAIPLGFLLGLTSCSDDSDTPVEIKLEASIAKTRSLNADEQTEFINAGHEVGVTIEGASVAHVNVPWISDGAGNLSHSQEPIYYTQKKAASIIAYHPYDATWQDVKNTAYTFSVATDQSSEGYAASDLLWANATKMASETAIVLNFTHRLSKIVMNFHSQDIENLTGAKVYISNTFVDVDFKNGLLQDLGEHQHEIFVGELDETGKACAIIIPQTIPAGQLFLRVVIDEKVYGYKMPDDKEFLSGYSYTYNLDVTNREETMDGTATLIPSFSEVIEWK